MENVASVSSEVLGLSSATGNTHENDVFSNSLGPEGDCSLATPIKNEKDIGVRNNVMEQVQNLMHGLEAKREADKRMVDEFRAHLTNMVNQMCDQVEQRLFTQHEETNKQVKIKLQYLNEIVERVCGVENDLCNFKSAVGNLFNDLHQ